MPLIAIPFVLLIGSAIGAVGATALFLSKHRDGEDLQARYDKQRDEQKK